MQTISCSTFIWGIDKKIQTSKTEISHLATCFPTNIFDSVTPDTSPKIPYRSQERERDKEKK